MIAFFNKQGVTENSSTSEASERNQASKILIKEMLLGNYTRQTPYTAGDLQQLTSYFAHFCRELNLKECQWYENQHHERRCQ